MARSIFDQDSIANKYSLLGQGSPNQQFIQEQKIQQGLLPRTQPTTQTNQTTANTTPVATSRNVKMGAKSPSRGNNLLQGVSNFVGTDFGTGFTQGLLGAGRYSPVPITFGQALSEAMQAGNQLVTDRGKAKTYRPMTMEERIKFGITDGNFAMGSDGLPVNLAKGGNTTVTLPGGRSELDKVGAENFMELGKVYGEEVKGANENLNRINTIQNLMAGVDENMFGAFSQTKADVMKILGGDVSNIENLNVQFGSFVMGQIQNTKGAVSEREMDYFGQISPTMGKTKKGLELMLQILEKTNQKVIDKKNFYDQWTMDYLAKNPDASGQQISSAWGLAESEYMKENGSILDQEMKKLLGSQLIEQFKNEGESFDVDVYGTEYQNHLSQIEKERDYDEGSAVLIDIQEGRAVFRFTRNGFYSAPVGIPNLDELKKNE